MYHRAINMIPLVPEDTIDAYGRHTTAGQAMVSTLVDEATYEGVRALRSVFVTFSHNGPSGLSFLLCLLRSGKVSLPGGKCNAGETAKSAARRECLEEVGIDINDYYIFRADTFYPARNDSTRCVTIIDIPVAEMVQPRLTPGDSVIAAEWMTLERLLAGIAPSPRIIRDDSWSAIIEVVRVRHYSCPALGPAIEAPMFGRCRAVGRWRPGEPFPEILEHDWTDDKLRPSFFSTKYVHSSQRRSVLYEHLESRRRNPGHIFEVVYDAGKDYDEDWDELFPVERDFDAPLIARIARALVWKKILIMQEPFVSTAFNTCLTDVEFFDVFDVNAE